MPWSASDAPRHTRKAKTPKAKRAFAYAANNVLIRKTHDEGRAVRAGNAAAAKSARKSSRGKRRSQRK